MADTDASGRRDVKQSVESSVALVRPGFGELPFTNPNPLGEFQHQLFDASYDHSPYSSFNNTGGSRGSGDSGAGFSLATNMHPFKIVQTVNDQGAVVTRVFLGRLRYCINTFNTVLEEDKVNEYHATEKTDGQSGRPDRKTGDVGAHTHTLGGSSGLVNSGSYSGANHTHSIDSGVTVSLENSHNHTVPDLTETTVDKFVTIKSQIAATGIIKEIEPTGFDTLNDTNEQFTGFKKKDFVGTFGSIFLKWKIILPSMEDIGANFNDQVLIPGGVEVVMQGNAAQTAEALSAQDTFEELALHDTTDPADNIDDVFDRRGGGNSETEAGKTAFFYVKLGVSNNPADGVNRLVEQHTYENVYWSPLILGRAHSS